MDRLGNRKRNITPKELSLDIDAIDAMIDRELGLLRGVVETFLKNPEPPIWVPPNYTTPSYHDFLTSLQIPSYRNGNPSLLLHNLQEGEIAEIFGDARHMCVAITVTSLLLTTGCRCICNTPGSGKTRRMLESLTRYWGFYFVAVPDVSAIGIRDLQNALDEVGEYCEWTSDLTSLLSSAQRVDQSEVNSAIASNLLKKVLAARIVVFELFLELVVQIDGSLQENHKHIWLLFQLFDRLDPHIATLHPFVQITRNCLRHASNEALDILIGRLDTIRDKFFTSFMLHSWAGRSTASC